MHEQTSQIWLTPEALDRIERVRAKAEIRYCEKKAAIDPTFSGRRWEAAVEKLAVEFIGQTLFYGFIPALTASGASIRDIRLEVDKVLRELIDEVMFSDKWPLLPTGQFSDEIIAGRKRRTIDSIRLSKNWKEHQDRLIGRHAGSSAAEANDSVSVNEANGHAAIAGEVAVRPGAADGGHGHAHVHKKELSAERDLSPRELLDQFKRAKGWTWPRLAAEAAKHLKERGSIPVENIFRIRNRHNAKADIREPLALIVGCAPDDLLWK